jgi:hypothetical protein
MRADKKVHAKVDQKVAQTAYETVALRALTRAGQTVVLLVEHLAGLKVAN